MLLAQRNPLKIVPSNFRVSSTSYHSRYQQSSVEPITIVDVARMDQHPGNLAATQILKYNFTKLDETLLYKFLKTYSNLKHLELNSCEITD